MTVESVSRSRGPRPPSRTLTRGSLREGAAVPSYGRNALGARELLRRGDLAEEPVALMAVLSSDPRGVEVVPVHPASMARWLSEGFARPSFGASVVTALISAANL